MAAVLTDEKDKGDRREKKQEKNRYKLRYSRGKEQEEWSLRKIEVKGHRNV